LFSEQHKILFPSPSEWFATTGVHGREFLYCGALLARLAGRSNRHSRCSSRSVLWYSSLQNCAARVTRNAQAGFMAQALQLPVGFALRHAVAYWSQLRQSSPLPPWPLPCIHPQEFPLASGLGLVT